MESRFLTFLIEIKHRKKVTGREEKKLSDTILILSLTELTFYTDFKQILLQN